VTQRRLRLAENRRFAAGAHVAGEHELVAGGADAPLDLRDADEAAGAQMAKQKPDRRFAGQLRGFRPVLFDPGHVDVGNEIVGVRALEHEHPRRLVGLGALDEGDEITHQLGPQRFMGGRQFPANRTPPSRRTSGVSAPRAAAIGAAGIAGGSPAARTPPRVGSVM
jgi:hypothetical protein